MKNNKLVFFPLWIKAIKVLSENPKDNVSRIAKKLNCTYAHAHEIFKGLERNDIITMVKDGRSKISTFTEKGFKLVEHIKIIIKLLDDDFVTKNRKHYIPEQIINNDNNIKLCDGEKDKKHN